MISFREPIIYETNPPNPKAVRTYLAQTGPSQSNLVVATLKMGSDK